MAVDNRLRTYFKNVRQYNLTGDTLWLEMLKTLSRESDAPGPRAAQRFLNSRQEGQTVGSG